MVAALWFTIVSIMANKRHAQPRPHPSIHTTSRPQVCFRLSMDITMPLLQMMMNGVKGHSDPPTAQGQYLNCLPPRTAFCLMLAVEFH